MWNSMINERDEPHIRTYAEILKQKQDDEGYQTTSSIRQVYFYIIFNNLIIFIKYLTFYIKYFFFIFLLIFFKCFNYRIVLKMIY